MQTASKRPKASPDTQEAQSERFIAMARQLGADESEERFNAKLKTVAGAKVGENEDTSIERNIKGRKTP